MKLFVFKLFALVIGVWVTPFLVTPRWNNGNLSVLQNRIVALPHPKGTTLLARHSDVGNAGNGHHLDYWAVELRSFARRKMQVQSAYHGLRVAVPNSDDDGFSDVKNGTQPVEIQILPSPLPRSYRVRCGNLNSWNLSAFAGRRDLYLVEILNSGDNDNPATLFDWRGD